MKLFASDYDGTYCKHTKDVKKQVAINVEKTKEWQASGNIFAFCTGRAIGLMTPEIKVHKLEYDYIIGLNGAIIVDKNQNVLLREIIPNEMVTDILNLITEENIPQYFITDGYNGYFKSKFYLTNYEWYLFQALKWTKKSFNLTKEQALANPVAQIAVKTSGHDQAVHFANKINEKFGHAVVAYPNLVHVDICAKGCSKASGVEFVANLQKIKEEQVYCIGDSHNDVPMIEKFNGFTMIEAVDAIKEKADYVVTTVDEAMNQLLKHK